MKIKRVLTLCMMAVVLGLAAWTVPSFPVTDRAETFLHAPYTRMKGLAAQKPAWRQEEGNSELTRETQAQSAELDERTKVSDTSMLPYSAICRLHLVFEDEQGEEHGFAGSGYVIDKYAILTCAHCLYDHEHGYGWLKEITIEPGRSEDDIPFGRYDMHDVDRLVVEDDWIASANESSDCGLIVLNTDIGSKTGMLHPAADPTETETVRLAGYPSEWKGIRVSGVPVEDTGSHVVCKARCIESDVSGSSGQSGSPIFNEQGEVVATYAYEYVFSDRRGGPMLDDARLAWIEANITPSRIVDDKPAAQSRDKQEPGEGIEEMGEAVYRLYNPNTGEHFYTMDGSEQKALVRLGWKDEGMAWMSTNEHKARPVYRLYNPNTSDHHYTIDKDEYDTLAKLGWIQEGESWRAYASSTEGTQTIYRLYNPHAFSGAHHFTCDRQEVETLVSLGWRSEQIAFYTAD